ncbi:MAG: hypothetical protein U0519_01330 [Candidatus Gracilibacteria bacterium]
MIIPRSHFGRSLMDRLGPEQNGVKNFLSMMGMCFGFPGVSGGKNTRGLWYFRIKMEMPAIMFSRRIRIIPEIPRCFSRLSTKIVVCQPRRKFTVLFLMRSKKLMEKPHGEKPSFSRTVSLRMLLQGGSLLGITMDLPLLPSIQKLVKMCRSRSVTILSGQLFTQALAFLNTPVLRIRPENLSK